MRPQKERFGAVSDKKLNRRLAALQRRVDLIQALMSFLEKHPAIVPYCTLKQIGNGPTLYFEEKGFIRPVWNNGPTLRLEKYFEDWPGDDNKSILYDDIYALSPVDLALLLKEKLRVDLSKSPGWEEGDDEEEDSSGAD
jgi:hypothetical protein